MPESNGRVGGSVKVKIRVGVQYISHGAGDMAVLDNTGTELDLDTGNVLSYTNGVGRLYCLEVDTSNTIVFTTATSSRAWTETGTGAATRVETVVGTLTKQIDVDLAGALVVDAVGTEAHIVFS